MDQTGSYRVAPLFSLNSEVAEKFCRRMFFSQGKLMGLADMRDANTVAALSEGASEFFPDIVRGIKDVLSNDTVGIVAVDVPVLYQNDMTVDAITGALLAISLAQYIMPSLLDRENGTPFSIFNASQENNKTLDSAGIKGASPTDILEFHSDGSIQNGLLSIPKHLFLYNILINYNRKGNFYWVPTPMITNIEEYFKYFGEGQDFIFDLTPTVYESRPSQIKSILAHRARTAVFRRIGGNSIVTFMNGTFRGRYDAIDGAAIERLAQFRNDISRSDCRYYVPQRARRIIFLRNDCGFHARDVLDEPIAGSSITRSYLRSASTEGHLVGRIETR